MQLDNLFKKIRADIETYEIQLHAASDKELLEISNLMGLALALPEMKRIKEYFGKQGRKPTDIELQALGQAWYEHCCYKSSKIPLKKYVFNVDENRIIAREDA
ncbi:MAG: phosphoribosylformylglycinamidine synthase II, partial [Euryarchaeota archaeon]|nr:phosphoribosylformylglycinamidine synthase II [Euryarchaeota archaeon]